MTYKSNIKEGIVMSDLTLNDSYGSQPTRYYSANLLSGKILYGKQGRIVSKVSFKPQDATDKKILKLFDIQKMDTVITSFALYNQIAQYAETDIVIFEDDGTKLIEHTIKDINPRTYLGFQVLADYTRYFAGKTFFEIIETKTSKKCFIGLKLVHDMLMTASETREITCVTELMSI